MSYQPQDTYVTNARLGVKIPRSILLPPYLLSNPYYSGLTDAMDAVFGPLVDQKIDAIQQIRNPWITNPAQETIISSGEMVDQSAWTLPERAILAKQANLLGMKLHNAGVITDIAYQNIVRYVGEYWFYKGTYNFIEFICFCLDVDVTMISLWTQDYVNFVPQVSAGTPVWEGGAWYPTTHVNLEVTSFEGLDVATLASFFYEIANFNLVLNAIDLPTTLTIIDAGNTTNNLANIVVVGMLEQTTYTIPTNGVTPN